MQNNGHPLQLWGWGELKSKHGSWSAHRLQFIATSDTGAEIAIGGTQILIRKLPFPFSQMVYVPRGPINSHENINNVLDALIEWIKNTTCATFIKIEPPWINDDNLLKSLGGRWCRSSMTIFIPNTIVLDLTKSNEQLLGQMTKKTRQYIRKSGRECSVRRVNLAQEPAVFEQIMSLYKTTSLRANFGIHNTTYYHDLSKLMENSNCIYIASEMGDQSGEIIAFLWNIRSPQCEFELYSGVSKLGQQLRANYALKWFAIESALNSKVNIYDLNGLVSYGVSNFKLGFIDNDFNKTTKWIGTLDYSLHNTKYTLWKFAIKLRKVVQAVRHMFNT